MTKEEFEKVFRLATQDIKEGIFAEYCTVHDNYYGTSKKALQSIIDKDKVLTIENEDLYPRYWCAGGQENQQQY